jgi:hypothetical protein
MQREAPARAPLFDAVRINLKQQLHNSGGLVGSEMVDGDHERQTMVGVSGEGCVRIDGEEILDHRQMRPRAIHRIVQREATIDISGLCASRIDLEEIFDHLQGRLIVEDRVMNWKTTDSTPRTRTLRVCLDDKLEGLNARIVSINNNVQRKSTAA